MNIVVDPFEEAEGLLPPAATIRAGEATDEEALSRLSALEEREPGPGPHLVAEQEGEIVAALSLGDGVALGDPFRPTAELIALLRTRATQIERTSAVEVAPHRTRLARRLALLASGSVALGLMAVGTAFAATVVSIAGTPVKINPQTKGFAISVSCASEADPCEGVLDVKTAGKIKPYSSPAKIEKVGTFPFSIAAGTTALVKGRVYGPALAEATRRGKVRLSITPRAMSGSLGPAKTVLFTYKRR